MRQAFRRSGFDGRAAIAADAGSGGIDQRHKHFLTAFVLAGAGVAKLTRSLLHALAAELRGWFGADRARDGRRLVPGQELQLAWKGGRSVLADDTQGQVGRAAEIVLMRENDAGFEFAAQGLAHQCVTVGIITTTRLALPDELLGHRGKVYRCSEPRPLSSYGELEGAQVIATFQPDAAEEVVEVVERAVGRCLQMQPISGRVTALHDQMEPARSGLARYGVLFPARPEMIGHLPFAKQPLAKAAFAGGKFVIHSRSR